MAHDNKSIFAQNLQKYVIGSGKDRKDIAKELEVPYSTFTDWMNGNKFPRINNIEKIASYFNISKSDLIEDLAKTQKDNDLLATIIVKMRTNKELFEVVEKLVSLEKNQLESLKRMLDTFA